jgi:hypothetical protein
LENGINLLGKKRGTSVALNLMVVQRDQYMNAKHMDLKANCMHPELTTRSPSDNNTPLGEAYPKRRSDLNYRRINGETLILNREEKRLHQLNPTASFIWDCCDGNAHVTAIIDRLTLAYEVDAGTARKDVETVLLKLRTSNLLEV